MALLSYPLIVYMGPLMKILVTGDLHGNKSQFLWIEGQMDQFDCLCLTGDFLDTRSGDFEQQAEWVVTWMQRLDKQLFICSGNHDLDENAECDWLIRIRSSKICVDNQAKVFNGIKFGCMPYLGADLSYFYNCDVLLTHVPPKNTATSKSTVNGQLLDWGDKNLYSALKHRIISPQYLLCGHVENPSARRDRLGCAEIINPGAHHNVSVPCHEILVIEN